MKFINCMVILKYNRFHVGFIFGMEMQFFGNFWSIPKVPIREWYVPDYPTLKHFIFDVYRLIMTLTTKQWADLNRKKGKPEKKREPCNYNKNEIKVFFIRLYHCVSLSSCFSFKAIINFLFAMGCECTHVDI